MMRRRTLMALRILGGVLAVIAVSAALLLWRLSLGPIGVPGIKGYLEADLSAARNGRPVVIGGVELAWPKRGMMVMQATDVRVLDSAGRVLTHSDAMLIGLSFRALLEGHVRITDALSHGGDITITNRADGSTTVAFGPPGAQPDIVLPPAPPDQTLREEVGRLLDGLRTALRPVGPGGRLNSLSVRGARLTVIDEASGGRWIAADAAFDLRRALRVLAIHASASLNGAKGPAPFALNLTTNTAFDSASLKLAITGARPQALGPFAPRGILAGLSAPVTVAVAATMDRTHGLTSLKGDLNLGRGALEYGGGKLDLDGGRIGGAYDVAHDTLTVRELRLAGERTKMTGDARLMHASALFKENAPQAASFVVASPVITFDMPGAFSGPVTLTGLSVAGDISGGAINVSKFEANLEDAQISVRGRVYWTKDAKGVAHPGLQAEGGVTGVVPAKTVLRAWPLQLAEGARTWLGRGLLDGRLSAITLNADIKPADFAAAAQSGLRDGALSVKFKYDHAGVRYVEQMLPISGAAGAGELHGNSFNLTVDRGQIGDLSLSAGRVLLPRLYPKGALATYAARVEGQARSMVNLMRQAPIGLDAHLPFDPNTIAGRGSVDFAIQRPLRTDIPDDAMLFKLDGRLDDAGGVAKNGQFTIAEWRLHLFGDQRALTFAGPLVVGKSHADLTWNEKLRDGGVSPSTIAMKGKLDARDIVSLGFPILDYARGPVGVDFHAEGKGENINRGEASLDFRDATVSLPKGFWVKQPGQPATVKFDIARQPDMTLLLNKVVAAGPGVSASGKAHLAASGDLLAAASPHVILDGSLDGRVSAKRDANQTLIVDVSASFLNIGPFFAPDHPDGDVPGAAIKPGKLSPAFEIDAASPRLRLRADADLVGASVIAGSDGKALTKFQLTGQDPGGKPFVLSILPTPGQPLGKLTLRAQDAGFAVRGITGQTNVKGGIAEADGAWKFAAQPTADIHVRMRDFRLVRVPAMAMLLQSVGSLTGMVDALNGEGIQFGVFEAPMTLADNQVTLGECRAAGPAVGLTAKGNVNLNNGHVAIDGVIVPSYGLNSFLGGLPIVGKLIVSRKGEGVFGLTYSMKGPADKPNVSVNPLSALTPGFLRRIFEPLPKAKDPDKEG